jgi:hypothetical protein
MKLNLASILSGFNLNKINNNFTAIENELQDKVLYRDNPVGEPNAMENVIDMNSNKIINLGAPVDATDAARMQDVLNATVGIVPASLITFTPYLDITSTNVQGAIQEVKDDVEAADATIATKVSIASLASSIGASLVGFIQAGVGAILRTLQAKARERVSIEDFGGVGDGVTLNDAAIWDAIVSLRSNPVTILRDIGAPATVLTHSSGILEFGPGIFRLSTDMLEITQDLGLQFRGKGSRRTNNSVRGATTLLFTGTSSGFGIKLWDNGARGFSAQDMDICYETSGFTGDLIDTLNCPGLTLTRCFVGTFGLTAPTRLQTARSLIRSTYDEFIHCVDCVFDGAIDGWWSDDARVQNGNTFGGSMTKLDSCVFYDFTGEPLRHDGLRNRANVDLVNVIINPISVDCQRGMDLINIDGLTVTSCGFAGSVANNAVVEWARFSNCTGTITGTTFDDNSKAGTFDGMLGMFGNRVFGVDGFTFTGGVITSKSNEFSKATSGYTISPTYPITVDLGPDLFKAAVTYSYDIPVDSTNLSGRVNYDSMNDASVSKFRNASGRISIRNLDEKALSNATAAYAVLVANTGRTVLATGAVAQVFTLPTPVPGTRLTITKLSAQNLDVTCAGGTNFYGVGSTTPTNAALVGAAMGTLELEAYATVGWIVKAQVSTWVYT